ncbi:mitotic-spindle organizing protein 2 isoform X2 [Festucalex cinctus]
MKVPPTCRTQLQAYLLVICDFADPLDVLVVTTPLIRLAGVWSTGASRDFLIEPRSASSELSVAESLGEIPATMSQQSGPSATDSPALVVTTTVQKYAMKKKEILNAEENELYELSQAAGITMDQEVFKIMVDLLKMNVAPQAVFQTLKAMCAGQRVPESCGGDIAAVSHGTGIPSTKAEARDESLSSGKSAKLPAGGPTGPGSRATRVSAKMAAYGAQDVGSAPHAQAVRSKAASSSSTTTPADKTREASGQRAQRQPSASRGQKTKSSGSSSSSSQMISGCRRCPPVFVTT